jgi:hypothetical protein
VASLGHVFVRLDPSGCADAGWVAALQMPSSESESVSLNQVVNSTLVAGRHVLLLISGRLTERNGVFGQ